MTSTTVPLNKLLLSPRNVRKTNGEEDIESMAASIASKGLLQNLVVSEAPGGRGFYEVDAGGRRWRAMQLLVSRRQLARNWPVPVIVVPAEDAAEASLAENLEKVAMNPADEVEAFAAILERYHDNGIVDRAEAVANLARRFGRTVRYVEQRLRMAALAPEILAALREGRVTIDAAQAYAGVSDHKLQLKVFAVQEKASYDKHRVAAIRAAYAEKVYRKEDRIVRYVGLEAYLEAGGRVDFDMFMGSEDQEVLTDTALLDQLAKAKADADADRIAQEAGFAAGVYSRLTVNYFDWPKAPQGFPKQRYQPLPDQRADAVAVLKLAEDGSELRLTDYSFVRADPAAAALPASRGPETEVERLARIRREKIETRAIRLASPKVEGTPLQGRASWPKPDTYWVKPIEQDPDGDFVVAMLVVIPAADVDRFRAQAERELEREEAGAPGPDEENDDDFDRPPAVDDEHAPAPELEECPA